MIPSKENLFDHFSTINEYWSPKVIAKVNDQYVKCAKLKGEFVWHQHELEDELFYVVKGSLQIQYSDHVINLNEGELHVVPKGVSHNPVAEDECWILLIETVSTKHTGEVKTDKTKSIEQQLK
jgi:mannose-6-phosphate isomerase-like protein (cupin superfamily)